MPWCTCLAPGASGFAALAGRKKESHLSLHRTGGVPAKLPVAARPEQNPSRTFCPRLCPRGRHHCLLTGAKDGVFGTCSLKLLSIVLCWGKNRGRRRHWHRAARLAGLKFGCLLKDSARDWELPRTLGALPPLSEFALPGEVHIHAGDASESVGLSACQPARYKSG